MINASEAKNIYLKNLPSTDAWEVLEEKIVDAAQNKHQKMVIFEETLSIYFKEERKTVKKKLEELGYEVRYERFAPDPLYYPSVYRSKYWVYWSKAE